MFIKRLIFTYKNYKLLKNRWGIKYPFINAIFEKRCSDIKTKLYKGE